MDSEDHQRKNIYDDLNDLLEFDDKEQAASSSPSKKNVKFKDQSDKNSEQIKSGRGNQNLLNIDIGKVKESMRNASAQGTSDNPETSTAKKRKRKNRKKKKKQDNVTEKDTQNGDDDLPSARIGPMVIEDSES